MRFLMILLVATSTIHGAIEYREEEVRLTQEEIVAIEDAREEAEQKAIQRHGGLRETCNSLAVTRGPDHRTTHRNSYHIYSGVTAYADQVELEDGSMWFVLPASRSNILDWNWTVGHSVAILKGNRNSNYSYRLYNEANNQTLEVELSAEPYAGRRLTIADIDKIGRTLTLSDGSRWMLPTNWFEQEVWMKWYINDIIIVGTNDQFFYSMFWPDILINVNCSATYTPSKCVN